MKKCTLCKETKDLSDFNKNKSRKDGLGTVCRECNKARSKRYYRENTDAHRQTMRLRNKAARARNYDIVEAFKDDKSCPFCGEDDNCCLEFHHLDPSTKKKGVADMLHDGNSLKLIFAEIAKCILICSNCHKKVHAGKISTAGSQALIVKQEAFNF